MASFGNRILSAGGRLLARHLGKPLKGHAPLVFTRIGPLRAALQPGDVLLVEGDTRVSVVIKYMTQSTWSHAALFVGARGAGAEDEAGELLEADVVEGVRRVPLAMYAGLHTRICRPVGLEASQIDAVLDFALARLGHHYDLKNLVDLARYLLPLPPVGGTARLRLLRLGSGEPTQAICSTLIAQAFQSVRYPILPYAEDGAEGELLRVRHHSLFTPRDFDLSPYFRIVKPRIEAGFDPAGLTWAESAFDHLHGPPAAVAGPAATPDAPPRSAVPSKR